MSSPVAENKSSVLINSHPQTQINIIVVDDDRDDANLVCDIIKTQSSKYGLINIQQSKEVLKTLDDFNYTELPALIILDYNMPVLTGLGLLRLLKKSPRYVHIPVVIYSNSTYPKHKEECLEAGACIYLLKSTTVQGLRDDVKQLLYHCL